MAKRVETNEGDGTIVGVHKHGVTIDLDNGGTVTRSEEVKKTFQQSRKSLNGNQYRIKENRMESKKYKLLESKLRKMVREELLKEEITKEGIFYQKFIRLYEEYMNYMRDQYGESKNYKNFDDAFKNFLKVTNLRSHPF